mmetsp:Transcript_25065/g.35994  ORF Transcript_25065/g.35994 Transcript_25065/m.35994 type:complete len:89 (+) Transcript_25065:538-804(+)
MSLNYASSVQSSESNDSVSLHSKDNGLKRKLVDINTSDEKNQRQCTERVSKAKPWQRTDEEQQDLQSKAARSQDSWEHTMKLLVQGRL